MSTNDRGSVFGVVGGVGPLASAEFLKTIYQFSITGAEQRSPIVVMYSDPTFPDRTELLLAGADDILLDRLVSVLRRLGESGAERILIACVTLHHLLPRLPRGLRERIVSLLDVTFAEVLTARRSHLLFCSSGSRQVRLFESHAQWPMAKDYIVMPEEGDQQIIHDLIYRVKRNQRLDGLMPVIESLLSKYGVSCFIAGCTEMHLVGKVFAGADGRRKGYSCIDPLTVVARRIAEGRI